jgi:hypothetical protein
MRKHFSLLFLLLTLGCFPLAAQSSSPCGAPTPGQPHVCLTFVAPATPPAVTGYNIYRATTANGENYGVPLNAAPLLPITLFYYDKTCAIGTTCFYTMASIGTGGVLSAPSSEVSAQIPVPPNSPTTPAAAID